MTEEQYEEYTKIKEEIEPLEFFLDWYKDSFLLKGIGYSHRSNAEIDLPREIKVEICKVIRNYVDRKKEELKRL